MGEIYAVLGLLLGMSMVFFRNPLAVVVEQAVRAVLGPKASRTSIRIMSLALIFLFAGAVVALLYLLPS